MHTAFTNGGLRASPRDVWEKRISELIDQAQQHQSPYTETFGPHTIMIHPSVYSPKYFPETWWYAQHLPPIVNKGSFLEVGVGSGLTSLSVAAAGSPVFGVDINREAVNVTQSNFEINHQKGTFVVSNIYQNVKGKFDFIYWNHPWQHDSNIPLQLKSEKTLDSEYQLLRRFVGEAHAYLTEKGVILLGTSAYANHEATVHIARENGYSCQELARGNESIGKGVFEEYYILELKRQ